MPQDGEQRQITSAEVNRPGLGLAGYFEYFDSTRIQIIGKGEYGYLEGLSPETRFWRTSRPSSWSRAIWRSFPN